MCCYNVEAVQGRNGFEGRMVKNMLLHNTEAAKRELACVLFKCLTDTPVGVDIQAEVGQRRVTPTCRSMGPTCERPWMEGRGG